MLTHEVRRVVTWHENSGTERRVFRDHDKALEWVDALCYAEDTLKEYSPVRFDSLEVGF